MPNAPPDQPEPEQPSAQPEPPAGGAAGVGLAVVVPDAATGPSLIPQPGGRGALLSGGKPGNQGGRIAAQRRKKAQAERAEAIREAITGQVERLVKLTGQLIRDIKKGEQWRCPQCGSFGPTKPKADLKELVDALRQLGGMVMRPADAPVGSPLQVNIHVPGQPVRSYEGDGR